ncbi:uncharacterized protein FPRO_10336 [Fusarium proliferatum ET1]|uniref:Uncharacterized protein n=1 Tax=Fusarium proliferatum (strain ET1) TaxID=1227346 RepID=A0A1L7VJM4_FUSPR|nr:uncharacterized protein FPRO_10336 [Fusarium proliferatum ET1]CZR40748.1 uncharacterized protein FPRO_10336 [Fusarium proliferatum ET1]
MSHEENIQHRLGEFISAFSARDRPNARFAHIKIPDFRMERPSLMESIRKSLSPENAKCMLFVTSELEKAVGHSLATAATAADGIKRQQMGYSEALRSVKMNRADAGDGSAWKSPRQGNLQQDVILPRNIIVVFQIDPTVPADCALALIAFVQWALDVAVDGESQVMVITLAVEDDCDFLSTLVAIRSRHVSVDYLDLSEPWDGAVLTTGPVETTMHRSTDVLETVKTIAAASSRDQDNRHLVLSFRDVDLAAQYETLVVKAETPFVESGLDDKGLIDVIQAPTFGHTWLTINPALWLSPVQFKGYQEIHILLGSQHTASVSWDNVTEQLVQYDRWTSREERISQLQWARQLSVRDVHIYHEQEEIESLEATLGSFIDSTSCRHRQVENSHLGGFITCVMSMAHWGLRIDQVLACFVRCPARLRSMRERLKIQRVITPTGTTLRDAEGLVFMTLLPLLNYDHRLALFVALDSDDIVRRVKLQLAAIMLTDVSMLAGLNVNEPLSPDGQEAGTILNSCLGYGSDIAPSGTLWMLLGLWKAFEVASDKGRENAPFWSLVQVNVALANRANRMFGAMSRILQKIGIGSAIHKGFEDETRGFGEEQKRVLQTHLLQAYIFQLVAAFPPFKDGEPDHEAPLTHLIMANNIEVTMPFIPIYVTSLVNLDRILADSGSDFALGISQSLLRLPGRRCGLMDWTAIPKDLVAEWLVEYRPGLDLLPALASLTRRHPENKDEIN